MYPSHVQRRAPLAVSYKRAGTFGAGTNRFFTSVFENFTTDATISDNDISSTNTVTLAPLRRSSVTTTGTGDNLVGGNFYGNACTKISVQNCDGPIYIRNFFSDANQNSDVAIEVINSKVLLENCTAVRAKKAGFKFSNSEVTLSRSTFSYRNYEIDPTDISSRIENQGIGYHLLNSDVTVSSRILDLTSTEVGDSGAEGRDAVVVASRNTQGFVLENSKLPMEIWHSREGISSYASIDEFLIAIDQFRKTGAKLNATYVYDIETGLKLFGKTAFFVKTDSGFTTFLRKPDADKFALEKSGTVMDIESALATLSS